MRRPRLFPWIAWLALAAPCAVRADDPPAPERSWAVARSRHFTVLAEQGRAQAVEVARKLERLTEVLASLEPDLRAASPRPTVVFAFRSAASFAPYRLPRSENLAGYFVTREDQDRIAYDASADTKESEVLYHEFVHGWLAHNFGSVPRWLNEGLATYYSTFVSGPATAEIGRPLWGMRDWLDRHDPFPIDRLFAIDMDTEEYRSKENRATFYAQSWALVHHLLHSSPENRTLLVTLLERVAAGRTGSEAEDELVPAARRGELLRDLRGYLGRTRFQSIEYTFTRRFDPAEVSVEAASPARVLSGLGDLLRAIGEEEAAERHLRAALRTDSTHARSMALLGCVLDSRGRTAPAESLYMVAAEADPSDPEIYAIAGRGAFERARRTGAPASSPAITAARARFARCLQMDPGNLEALVGFGKLGRADSDPPAAAAGALRAASRALPARLDLRSDLVHVLARLERCAEADSVYRTMEPSGRTDVLRSGVASLIACRLARLERENAGRTLTAALEPGELDAVLLDPAMREYARAEIAKLAPVPRGTPIVASAGREAARAFQSALEALNLGLREANRGDFDRALARLYEARPPATATELIERIEAARVSVRHRKRLRDGVALLNAGEVAAARDLFRELVASAPDDSARAYAQRLEKRAEARLAIESGVKMAKRGESGAAIAKLDSLGDARIDDDLRAYARSLGGQVETRVEVDKGIALLRQSRLKEALAHFEALHAAPASENLRLYLRNLITHTRARLDVSRAIDRLEAGRRDEARAVLAGVLERPIGSHLREYVQDLLAKIDGRGPR